MTYKTLRLLVIAHLFLFPKLFSQTSEQLRANLYAVNAEGTYDLYDGNLTMYNVNNTNDIDGEDAVKMSNFGENFGLLRGTTTLVIERRASIVTADTTFFKMWNMRNTTYKIDMWLTGLDHPGLSGVLEDAYLGTTTALNLNAANSYTFTVSDIPASSASDRFRIIFSTLPVAMSSLPFTFTDVRIFKKNRQVNLEWIVENQQGVISYEVQRSSNGRPFAAASQIVTGVLNQSIYQCAVVSSSTGDNKYRIRSTDTGGKVAYSAVTEISNDKLTAAVVVYPNPVINKTLNLELYSEQRGIYAARIINYNGQLLDIVQFHHNGGKSIQTIHLNKSAYRGVYHLEIITPGKNIISKNLFLQ